MENNKEEQLVIEPIIGYRTFNIVCINKRKKEFRLKGIGIGDKAEYWKNDINIAKCLKNKKHKVPDFNCECGFYIYKYKMDFIDYIKRLEEPIAGEVEATGRVIEHRDGYRAEKAKIKKLILCFDNELSIRCTEKPKRKKIKKKEKNEEEQLMRTWYEAMQQALAQQSAFQQTLGVYQHQQTPQPSPQPPFNSSWWGSGSLESSIGTFKEEDIIKSLQSYYKVPIIYYKDYLEKELFK